MFRFPVLAALFRTSRVFSYKNPAHILIMLVKGWNSTFYKTGPLLQRLKRNAYKLIKFLSFLNKVKVVILTFNKEVQRCTVRLLTHVLCEPTHFFFLSFIATMSYSLQTSFSSVMKNWADKYHVWGTPRGHLQGQTRENSNMRFFTLKSNTYTCVLIYYPSYIYVVSYLVWRGLLCFIILQTNMECICRWKFIKNKKLEKWGIFSATPHLSCLLF